MLETLFEKHSGEFLKHKEFKGRKDLRIFEILDRLVPGDEDMIAASEHDEIFLSISPEKFAEVATEEDIVELIRCGLCYDTGDGFTMFV